MNNIPDHIMTELLEVTWQEVEPELNEKVGFIALNRGHWQDVVPCVAHAAQRKLLEWGLGQCDIPEHGRDGVQRFDCGNCMADLQTKLEK